MYRYLPITLNLHEMMVMLKSLPAYTLVFDNGSNLVDLNKPAMQLLEINSIQEFNDRKDEVFPTPDYIERIIPELKKGKTVRNIKALLKCTGDKQFAAIEFCACMINGCQDLFLFQFFEISPPLNLGLETLSSDVKHVNLNPASSQQENNQHEGEDEQKDGQSNKFLVKGRQQNPKYRKLTEMETIVGRLVEFNMSVSQIADTINKENMATRSIIRRVVEKQKINSIASSRAELKKCGQMSHVARKKEAS